MKKLIIGALAGLLTLTTCGSEKSGTATLPPPDPSKESTTQTTEKEDEGGTTSTSTGPELPDNNAIRRMKALGVGWNLGNQLDALPDGFSDDDDEYGWPDETCCGRDTYGQEKHCYTNHGTGEFLSSGQEPIETVIRAWTSEDPAYTLQSVYDRAPVF